MAAGLSSNTPAENQTLYEHLVSLYGENFSYEDFLKELSAEGIVDENGNIIPVTATIDGVPYDSDALRELLSNPDTDLSRTATMDGTTVTLENLAKMLQIVDFVTQVGNAMSASGMNGEQMAAFSSLVSQLATSGISTVPAAAYTPVQRGVYVKVVLSAIPYYDRFISPCSFFYADTFQNEVSWYSLSFQLVNSAGNSITSANDVSFKVCAISGNADYAKYVKLTDSAGTTLSNGTTLTIPAGSSNVTLTVKSDKTLPAGQQLPSSGYTTANDIEFYAQGSKTFLVKAYDLEDAVFQDGTTSYDKIVTINFPAYNKLGDLTIHQRRPGYNKIPMSGQYYVENKFIFEYQYSVRNLIFNNVFPNNGSWNIWDNTYKVTSPKSANTGYPLFLYKNYDDGTTTVNENDAKYTASAQIDKDGYGTATIDLTLTNEDVKMLAKTGQLSSLKLPIVFDTSLLAETSAETVKWKQYNFALNATYEAQMGDNSTLTKDSHSGFMLPDLLDPSTASYDPDLRDPHDSTYPKDQADLIDFLKNIENAIAYNNYYYAYYYGRSGILTEADQAGEISCQKTADCSITMTVNFKPEETASTDYRTTVAYDDYQAFLYRQANGSVAGKDPGSSTLNPAYQLKSNSANNIFGFSTIAAQLPAENYNNYESFEIPLNDAMRAALAETGTVQLTFQCQVDTAKLDTLRDDPTVNFQVKNTYAAGYQTPDLAEFEYTLNSNSTYMPKSNVMVYATVGSNERNPEVVSVEAMAGTYLPGDYIPLVVTYNMPVTTDVHTVLGRVNGVDLYARTEEYALGSPYNLFSSSTYTGTDRLYCTSNQQVMYYEVPKTNTPAQIVVQELYGQISTYNANGKTVAKSIDIDMTGNHPYVLDVTDFSGVTVNTDAAVIESHPEYQLSNLSAVFSGRYLRIYAAAPVSESSSLKDKTFAVVRKDGAITAVVPLNSLTANGNDMVILNGYCQCPVNTTGAPMDYSVELVYGSAEAYKIVYSQDIVHVTQAAQTADQAVVTLTKPEKTMLLDTETSQTVAFTLENYQNDAASSYTVTVDRNGTQLAVTPTLDGSGTTYSGSLSFPISPVTEDKTLREVYTVTVAAKNSAGETESFDSAVFYVYRHDALKILDGKSITVTNIGSAKLQHLDAMTASDIANLRADLSLQEAVSINYGDYAWSQLEDFISWQVSDTTKARLNYAQGGVYAPITSYAYDAYLPSSEFMLSGVSNGTTTLTAKHAATGMTATADVTVETLANKLYLFQIYPANRAELSYTDGNGAKKTVTTNADGALALYEENGIISAVQIISSDGSYAGSIAAAALLSGEKDFTRLEYYPLNTLTLHRLSEAVVYLKTPDGSAYTGSVILRGGVYKNGVYCPDALLNGKDGKSDQTLTSDTEGKLVIQADASQFYTAQEQSGTRVQPGDSIKYIFELQFADNAYFPQFVSLSGNLGEEEAIRTAAQVFWLTQTQSDDENKPFIVSQTMTDDWNITTDLRNFSYYIGPNRTTEKVTVTTSYMLWGNDHSEYKLSMEDENGYTSAQQQSADSSYPFSSFPLITNTLVIDRATSSDTAWLANGPVALHMNLFDAEGALLSRQTLPFKAADIPKSDFAEDPALLNAQDEADNSTVSQPYSAPGGALGIILKGVSFVSKYAPHSLPVDLQITPSDKGGSVYNVYIFAGVGSTHDVQGQEKGLITEFDPGTPSVGITGMGDVKKYATGKADLMTDIDNKVTTYKQGVESEGSGELSPKLTLNGYYMGTIQYNFEKKKWEFQFDGGGMNVGLGLSYEYTFNTPEIPVTLTLGLGGSILVSANQKFVTPEMNTAEWKDSDAKRSSDFLLDLEYSLMMKAGIGIGVDIVVFAARVGIFGQIDLGGASRFLYSPYLKNASDRFHYGQSINIAGTIGVETAIKFLLVTVKSTLSFKVGYNWVLADYNDIARYWNGDGGAALFSMRSYSPYISDVETLASQTTVESRDYLTQAQPRMMMLRRADPSLIESNAYPYSQPLLSDDGTMLVYMSDGRSTDLADTGPAYMVKGTSGWSAGSAAISKTDGTGASYNAASLSYDGGSDSGAAVWVRQSANIQKAAGEAVTEDEQIHIISSSEIMLSTWDGTAWTTHNVTANTAPDYAPQVTVANNKATVVWRQASADAALDIVSGKAVKDKLMMRVYDLSDGSATDPVEIYNGTSGAITGLTAESLATGETAVAYSVDTSPAGTAADQTAFYSEIFYQVFDASGKSVKSVRLTTDTVADVNPNLTTVTYGSSERFLLGWYANTASGSARLALFDGSGTLNPAFPTSYDGVGSDVRFAEHSDKDLSSIALVWSEQQSQTDSADESIIHRNSVLKSVKFTGTDTAPGFSGVLTLCELAADNVADSYSCALTGNSLSAVTLASVYNYNKATYYVKGADGNYTAQSTVPEDGSEYVTIPSSSSKLYTAANEFTDVFTASPSGADYANLRTNAPVALQFTITNNGINPITSAEVSLDGGKETQSFTGLNLLPGESVALNMNHNVGGKVEDIAYSITATFAGGGSDTQSGTLVLNYPDVGISKAEVLFEKAGSRTVRVTLYNKCAAKLADSGNTVELGLYQSSGGTELGKVTVSGDDLKKIDDGTYTTTINFDAVKYLGSDVNIPDAGLTLYLESRIVDQNGSARAELYSDNNTKSIVVMPLGASGACAETNGIQLQTAAARLRASSGAGTEQQVLLRNLHLASVAEASYVIQLLDERGNVLENFTTGPLVFAAEEQKALSVPFTKTGAGIRAVRAGDLYTVSLDASPAAGGSVTGGGLYNENASVTVTATANTGYHFVKWTENGASVSTDAGYTFNAAGNRSLTAVFEPDAPKPVSYTIIQGAGQSISVSSGEDATFRSDADFSKFVKLQIDALDVASNCYLAFSGSTVITLKASYIATLSTGRHTISIISTDGQADAAFTVVRGGEPAPLYYTITASAGAGGSVTPDGSVSVREGLDQTFRITPRAGYVISDVLVDGTSVKSQLTDNSYTFRDVQNAHTLEATFLLKDGTAPGTNDAASGIWIFVMIVGWLGCVVLLLAKRKSRMQ